MKEKCPVYDKCAPFIGKHHDYCSDHKRAKLDCQLLKSLMVEKRHRQ